MATDVQNAVGTQRQFRKLPQSVYQANLRNPSFGSHISKSANYKAEQLANSLGVLGKAMWQEKVAEEERKLNQFTLEEGLRMVAGKTDKDLADFDRMAALQHADTGYNLTDNKYAMAVLERAMGTQAAFNAKREWLEANEGVVPKSVEDAVGAYTQHVQDSLDKFKDNISNKEAFNSGFEGTYFRDVLEVAENARQAIDKDKREAGLRCMGQRFQDLVVNYKNLPAEDFKGQLDEVARTIQVCTKTASEAAEVWNNILKANSNYFKDPALLDIIKELNMFTGADGKAHILGKEVLLGSYYELAIDSTIKDKSSSIIEQAKRPDGSYDLDKAMELVKAEGIQQTAIPTETLPINPGKEEAVAQLKPEWHNGVLPNINATLKEHGYTDVCITSGKRAPGQAGKAGNRSFHVSGDAIDIWLGEGLTREQGNQIAEVFRKTGAFKEVLWEMKGDPTGATGDHLHLAGYSGGFDKTQTTNIQYSPDYQDKLEQQIKRDINERNRQLEDRWKQTENDLMVSLYQTDSLTERRKLIKDADLPSHKKVHYLKQLDAEEEARAKAEEKLRKGNLSPLARRWETYGSEQYWKDVHKCEYFQYKKNQGEELTEEEEETWLKLRITRDAFYSYLAVREGIEYESQYGYKGGLYVGGQGTADEQEAIAQAVAKAKEAGYKDEEIKAYLDAQGLTLTGTGGGS